METIKINKTKLSKASKQKLRSYLQRELAIRIGRNPSYSLRSFAKSLGVDSGYLSRLLSGKREITESFFNKALSNIAISSQELEEIQSADNQDKTNFKNISLEHFKVISDWYHYAILELSRIKSFKSDPRWIAKKLGISIHEARDAIGRLIELEYLEIDSNGTMRDISGNLNTISNDFTHTAFKNLQQQVLEKALSALRDTPFEERSQTSLTFPLPKKEIKNLKKMIQDFNNELTNYVEEKVPQSDAVYHYSVSLYPVTNNEI